MKQTRFRRPEFQEKLARARRFQRAVPPAGKSGGVGSRIAEIAGILFVLTAVYFLTLSPAFLIRKVVLLSEEPEIGEVTAVLKRLENDRIYLVPRNHFLWLTEESFFKALQADLPEIRKLNSFRRIFPDTIEVGLETRKPQYVWQSGENYYFLDQDGVVLLKLENYDSAALPQILIIDNTAEAVSVGQELGIPRILDFLPKLLELWPRQISDTEVLSFSVPGTKSLDLLAKTALGFQVFFDLERRPEVQIVNLSLLLKREINPETYTRLSYIDLRLPNVAYYCYKDAPCASSAFPSP